MSRLIDTGLEQLTNMLVRMGDVAYNTVSLAVIGCIEGRSVYAQVKCLSDTLVSMEEDVEDKIYELISRFQPVASDLRILKSYMKIAYDLTRYGRYAFDTSQTQEIFGSIGDCNRWIEEAIEMMGKKVLEMAEISIEALKSHDVELAKTLSKIEEEVDMLYSRYLNKLIEEKPSSKCAVSSVLVIRYLERMADHATYIGESVIYAATGEKITLR